MCPYIITKLLQAVAMSPLFLSKSHSLDNKQRHMGPIVQRST